MSNAVAALTLSTKNCSLTVDPRSGMLADFMFAGKDLRPWRDFYIPWNDSNLAPAELYRRQGGVRITDELTGVEYRDAFGAGMTYYNECRKSHAALPGTACRVSRLVWTRQGALTRVAFQKQFTGAPFRLEYVLTANAGELHWQVELVPRAGIRPRSVRIELVLPAMGHPGLRPPWSVWAPVAGAPFHYSSPGGYGHDGAAWEYLRFPYANAKGDHRLTVPVIDVYSEKLDAGLALAVPFELHKPELIFEVDKLAGEIRLVFDNLALARGTRPAAAVLMHAHSGDWRPGLGWIYRRYRPYFTAGDRPRIMRQQGPMSYSFPVLTDEVIRNWKRDMHFSWTEALFAPTFGDYVPHARTWTFDMMKSAKRPECEMQLSHAEMRAYFRRLERRGVASFAYFNVGECEKELAERCYPESIMRLDHGHAAAEWLWPDGRRRNVRMRPDPESRWGRAMLRQLDALFKTYPALSGIFLDQACYRTYDFASADGRTMLANRPCFDTHTVFPRMVERIVRILRRHGRTAFTNGPYCIEAQKGLDGIMSEGRIPGIAQYAYMGLDKAVMILTYGAALDKFECALQACLKYGAFPDVRDHLAMRPRPRITPAERDLYARYLPLFEALRGRQWVFHPHALALPDGYDGNIFLNPQNRYVVTLFPRCGLATDRRNLVRREIRLCLPDAGAPRQAAWLSVNFKGKKFLPLTPDGRHAWRLRVPRYTDASLFVI